MDVDPKARPDLWSGALAWTPSERGSQPWRLLPSEERYAYAPGLYEQARFGAAIRLEAMLEARRLTLEIDVAGNPGAPVDVLIDGALTNRQSGGEHRYVEAALPHREVALEVWLPHHQEVSVRRLCLDDVTSLRALERTRPRWVAYGSSITLCKAAEGPSTTWPALAARALDWDLTCLGFGGNCHLDPVVSRSIAGLDLDVVSVCLGVNVHGEQTFSRRSWAGQVAELIRRIREAHASALIVVISPIVSPNKDTVPNGTGLTLNEIRDTVHQVATDFAERGDDRVVPLDGRHLLGPAHADLLHDRVHPGPAGYRLIAQRFVELMEQHTAVVVGRAEEGLLHGRH